MNVKVGDKIRIVSKIVEWPNGGIDRMYHNFDLEDIVTITKIYPGGTIGAVNSGGLTQLLLPCHYKKVNMRFTNK